MTLARLTPPIAPDLRVLSGISRADRWPELPSSSLDAVWTVARSLAGVDRDRLRLLPRAGRGCSATTPGRRAGTPRPSAPSRRRTSCSWSAPGDPVGIQRLVRGLGELTDLGLGGTRFVLVNRVRASVAGPHPGEAVAAGARPVRGRHRRAPGARRPPVPRHGPAGGTDAARGRARARRCGARSAGVAVRVDALLVAVPAEEPVRGGRADRARPGAGAAVRARAGHTGLVRIYLPASLDQLDPAVRPADAASRARGDPGAAGDVPRRGRRGSGVRGAARRGRRLARACSAELPGGSALRLRGVGRTSPTATVLAAVDDDDVPSAVELTARGRPQADVICVHVDEPGGGGRRRRWPPGATSAAIERLDERDLLWYDASELASVPR